MKLPASRMVALASVGLLALVAAPTVSPAQEEQPPTEQTGGLARTEEELGALGRLAEMPELTLQRKAKDAYNLGLRHRDKAIRLEQEAAAATGEKAAKKVAKAHKSYDKAIEQFSKAVEHVPGFAEALGCLGHALLQTGRYPEALVAYNQALALGPPYPEAIAERGRVYLGLDKVEQAKGAYLELRRFDRPRAAELMTAMRGWVERRRRDPGGLSQEFIESFAAWIEATGEPPSPS